MLWFWWRGEWRTGRVPLPPSFSLLSLRDIELWFPLFSLKTRGSFKERRRLYDRAMDGRTDVEIASADHKSTSSDESVPPPALATTACYLANACRLSCSCSRSDSVGKVDMIRQKLLLSNHATCQCRSKYWRSHLLLPRSRPLYFKCNGSKQIGYILYFCIIEEHLKKIAITTPSVSISPACSSKGANRKRLYTAPIEPLRPQSERAQDNVKDYCRCCATLGRKGDRTCGTRAPHEWCSVGRQAPLAAPEVAGSEVVTRRISHTRRRRQCRSYLPSASAPLFLSPSLPP